MAERKLQRRTQSIDDVSSVLAFCYAAIAEMAFAFGRFSTQQMTSIRAAVLRFALRRDLKPALHPFVSFLLGHSD